ncbi:MAG: chromate resistance protein ChrB domain-containing protein [Gemmatimonadaceae bacterium]
MGRAVGDPPAHPRQPDGDPDDPALQRLALIVRSADFPEALNLTPEGPGLRGISSGFPLAARDDRETVERAGFLYDALYASLQEQSRNKA